MPRSVISAHETGRRIPSKYHIQKYNEIFGCDITQFVPTKTREKMVTKTLRIPPNLYADLQKEAEQNKMDISKYIRCLLEKGIQEDYITKSMDTIIILMREALDRELKKHKDKEMPIMMLQMIYLIRFFMRDSLHMNSIELQEMMNDAKELATDDYHKNLRKKIG